VPARSIHKRRNDTLGIRTRGGDRTGGPEADAQARKRKYHIGDIVFHQYAFLLRSRDDVDELDAFLRNELKATLVDPAGEYYDNYYAVFFLDPDGMKLEGMKYGENHAKTGQA
jgi:hypothetical protein